MYIDHDLAVSIGIAYGGIVTGVAWIFGKVWKSYIKLQTEKSETLKLQLTDNERRRDLWDKQSETINRSAEAVKDLTREIVELRRDQARELMLLKAEIVRLQTQRAG